mmetsp:Transcript_16253/g.56720  ORF Transcript_16253/g.56720 Transcript_16253/m.56720 type:complete len:268 (-) Transcript_16253:231-1034(-)
MTVPAMAAEQGRQRRLKRLLLRHRHRLGHHGHGRAGATVVVQAHHGDVGHAEGPPQRRREVRRDGELREEAALDRGFDLQAEVLAEGTQAHQDLFRGEHAWLGRRQAHRPPRGSTRAKEHEPQLADDQVLVHERAAAVAAALEDGQQSRRRLAGSSEIFLQVKHRLVEPTFVVGADVHVDRNALQSPQALRRTMKCCCDSDDATAQLGPERGEANYGVAAVGDANKQKTATFDLVLAQQVPAKLVHVPNAVALLTASLEHQGRMLRP